MWNNRDCLVTRCLMDMWSDSCLGYSMALRGVGENSNFWHFSKIRNFSLNSRKGRISARFCRTILKRHKFCFLDSMCSFALTRARKSQNLQFFGYFMQQLQSARGLSYFSIGKSSIEWGRVCSVQHRYREGLGSRQHRYEEGLGSRQHQSSGGVGF